jgi:hypothetical protein
MGMFWRYWARERGSDPPTYSPVIREGGRSLVLTTITSHQLSAEAVVLGEFTRQRETTAGPSVPLERPATGAGAPLT